MSHSTNRERRKQFKAKRNPFPESNRFFQQLRILSVTMAPYWGYRFRSAAFRFRSGAAAAGEKLRAASARVKIPASAYLAGSAAIAAVAVFFSLYTLGTTIIYDGDVVGTVSGQDAAAQVISQVEDEVSGVLGDSFTLDESLVSYSTGLVDRRSVEGETEIQSSLSSQLDLVTHAYSLYVDGTYIGSNPNKEALEALLDQVKAPYINENTQSVEILEDVEIREGYVSTEDITSLADMVLTLNETKVGEVTYTVVKGDSYYEIAMANDLTVDELLALNPGFDVNQLRVGDELVISNAVPYLTIQATQYEYYTEDIPYEIQYVDDATMWEGDTSVVTPGAYGKADTTALVTYVNSTETKREIVEQTTNTEPTTAVYKRGTKERPSWAPTGTFRWPTNGNITSRFGYRTIFGGSDFHGGIDIANSRGTNIYAADGGVVTYAGWMSSYGYLIIIDHLNGYTTYYGHNSSLLVSVGDHVYKGQHIAEMGATGRVTGTHCHFEIRYNDQRKNPLNYLP